MGMELTWLAIVAALLMGSGAALMFVFAVKRDYFRDLEDTKYQVFWSEVEELVNSTHSNSGPVQPPSAPSSQSSGDGPGNRPPQ